MTYKKPTEVGKGAQYQISSYTCYNGYYQKSTKQVNIGEVCGEIKCLYASGENAIGTLIMYQTDHMEHSLV